MAKSIENQNIINRCNNERGNILILWLVFLYLTIFFI
jgi:hypothetical protein